jgi:REP element-mobilizing transposase RayT
MRRNRIALFLHLVWRTWDRLPLIRPEFERQMYRMFAAEAESLGCRVVAASGTDDHVHVLVQLATKTSIANLVKNMKGTTSRWIDVSYPGTTPFKWQGHYGAFTVSRWDVDRIAAYVRDQKSHHAAGKLIGELEETDEPVPPHDDL